MWVDKKLGRRFQVNFLKQQFTEKTVKYPRFADNPLFLTLQTRTFADTT